MPIARLKEFLDRNGVKYTVTRHSPAYTALEVAQAAHVPGKEVAKTVMVWLDDCLALAVVPASKRVSMEGLAAVTGYRQARLASEEDFRRTFPGCEVGAMPPFGNLWDLPVFVSESLAEDERIAFSAGTHTEVLQLAFADFRRLVHPTILRFSVNRVAPPQAVHA